LSRKLEFTKDQQGGERLVDSDMNGVMMGWEDPLMLLHADLITKDRAPRLRVLNVGFGLGLIDTYLQNSHPSSHTIIEAHPDVYQKMINDGWDKKVTILFGRWQDVKDQLQVYDAIFFDTFGEYMDDLKEFHELLPNILREDGIYSFFNGLAATDTFLHDVACRICELDLCDIGFQVEWTKIEMDKLGDAVWKGIKREYFSLPIYNLPKVTFNF
jgi:protein arginine N-methyltransferase 2